MPCDWSTYSFTKKMMNCFLPELACCVLCRGGEVGHKVTPTVLTTTWLPSSMAVMEDDAEGNRERD